MIRITFTSVLSRPNLIHVSFQGAKMNLFSPSPLRGSGKNKFIFATRKLTWMRLGRDKMDVNVILIILPNIFWLKNKKKSHFLASWARILFLPSWLRKWKFLLLWRAIENDKNNICVRFISAFDFCEKLVSHSTSDETLYLYLKNESQTTSYVFSKTNDEIDNSFHSYNTLAVCISESFWS